MAPRRRLKRVGMVLLFGVLAGGGTAGMVLAQDVSPLPDRPARPDGWPTVESGAGDLRLSLPPDILITDASEAIFANEIPPSEGAWVEVMAEGPTTAYPQPAADQPLEEWLMVRWPVGESLIGSATTRELLLPAGEAVEWRGTIEADPVRSVVLYAIRTARGTAFLVIDGPPERMAARESDIDLIARLLEVPS